MTRLYESCCVYMGSAFAVLNMYCRGCESVLSIKTTLGEYIGAPENDSDEPTDTDFHEQDTKLDTQSDQADRATAITIVLKVSNITRPRNRKDSPELHVP